MYDLGSTTEYHGCIDSATNEISNPWCVWHIVQYLMPCKRQAWG